MATSAWSTIAAPDAVKTLVGEGATGVDSLKGFVAGDGEAARTSGSWCRRAGRPSRRSTSSPRSSSPATPSSTAATRSSRTTSAARRRSPRKKINYVDAGTSGGVYGLERGYCMMIGGDTEVVKRLDPIFKTLAPGRGDVERTPGREKAGGTAEEGYLHCGPVGAGHFVKMVHNGIEYGIMQAIAEGFDIMKGAANPTVAEEHRFDIPVAEVAEVWRRGSVLSSWLIDLTAKALVEDPQLTKFTGSVQDSGEGRWTVRPRSRRPCPADVIAAALFTRFRSRQEQLVRREGAVGDALPVRRPRRAARSGG